MKHFRTVAAARSISSSSYNKRIIVDDNLRVAKTFGIPYGPAFTHNNSDPETGNMFYNTTLKQLGLWNGTAWELSGIKLSQIEEMLANYAIIPDGFKSFDGFYRAGMDVSLVNPITWRVNSVDHTKNTNSDFTITTAVDNRIDLIYGKDDGTIDIVVGVDGAGVVPDLPEDAVKLATVQVTGANIIDVIDYVDKPLAKYETDAKYVKNQSSLTSPQIGNVVMTGKGRFGSAGNQIDVEGGYLRQVGTNPDKFELKVSTNGYLSAGSFTFYAIQSDGTETNAGRFNSYGQWLLYELSVDTLTLPSLPLQETSDFELVVRNNASNLASKLSGKNLSRIKTIVITGGDAADFGHADFIGYSIEAINHGSTWYQKSDITFNSVTGVVTLAVLDGDELTVFFK